MLVYQRVWIIAVAIASMVPWCTTFLLGIFGIQIIKNRNETG